MGWGPVRAGLYTPVESEWFRFLLSCPLDLAKTSHEKSKLVPSWDLPSPKIKASDAMLFDSGNRRQIGMKSAILTEYDPSLSTDFC
jgi:hypothetical protein